jgi:hypothetical protein
VSEIRRTKVEPTPCTKKRPNLLPPPAVGERIIRRTQLGQSNEGLSSMPAIACAQPVRTWHGESTWRARIVDAGHDETAASLAATRPSADVESSVNDSLDKC